MAGSFRFWFADQRWEWSAEIFRMHGYVPGEIEPTTELLLAHKHPDDREHVAEAIARSVERGEPFSSRHRFIDTHGTEHSVMVVADRLLDTDGRSIGTSGFYIDLSQTLAEAEQEALNQRLPDIVESRAVIERAKGVLMRMYGINEAQAFLGPGVAVTGDQHQTACLGRTTGRRTAHLDPACPRDRDRVRPSVTDSARAHIARVNTPRWWPGRSLACLDTRR